MEQMLRQALITLVERNRTCRPTEQFTLLHVEPLLQDDHFRAAVLTQLGPPAATTTGGRDYYDRRLGRGCARR